MSRPKVSLDLGSWITSNETVYSVLYSGGHGTCGPVGDNVGVHYCVKASPCGAAAKLCFCFIILDQKLCYVFLIHHLAFDLCRSWLLQTRAFRYRHSVAIQPSTILKQASDTGRKRLIIFLLYYVFFSLLSLHISTDAFNRSNSPTPPNNIADTPDVRP